MALAGCDKFLDRKPLKSTLEDLNQGSLEGQVLNMYTILRTYGAFSSIPWVDFFSIRGDDAKKGSDRNDGKEHEDQFDKYIYAKDAWAPNDFWNGSYTMINTANNAIAEARSFETELDEPSKRNVGEACFFMAYTYFNLVRSFGEVPLINFPIINPADAIQPKSSVDIIYAFIDSNLQVASEFLPLNAAVYGVGYEGRLTKGAADALWAYTKLYRQDWAGVVQLCNQIITSGEYSLNENFSQNWFEGPGGAGKNGPESIFEMQAWTGQSAQSNPSVDNGSAWGTMHQIRQNGAPVEWNLGWGWNVPTDKLDADWPDDDPRKLQTILYSGQPDGGPALGGWGATIPPFTDEDGSSPGLAQKFWNKKLYTGDNPELRTFTGFINNNGAAPWINHRIIRYAEVYLMLAEASNELGDGATAETALEVIRNRASGNLGEGRTIVPKIAFSNQAQMRQAIKDERRWELAMEGHRFFDLVRWGDAVTVLGPLGYTNKHRYHPIPQQAIDLSGGVLEQNPEW